MDMATQLSYLSHLGIIALFPLIFYIIHFRNWKKMHIHTVLITLLIVSLPYVLFDWVGAQIGL